MTRVTFGFSMIGALIVAIAMSCEDDSKYKTDGPTPSNPTGGMGGAPGASGGTGGGSGNGGSMAGGSGADGSADAGQD